MGPLLMFDKSFLQMLNSDEVSELSMYFKFVGTPLLIREIISDLKKDQQDRRLPEVVVSTLASKRWRAHGLQPANFRKLAIANLCCFFDVPMIGQVPVDTTAPNVFLTDGGRGLLVDSTMEQEMWERWAHGDFTADDERSPSIWRAGVQSINLHAVGKKWKEYANERFGSAKNLQELIALVNGVLDAFNSETQFNALVMLMRFLNLSPQAAEWAVMLFKAGLMPRIRDLSPYAASILRLYLTFVGGLGRGFIGPRPSNYVDLQYLFYAPFCMVFVSADKFHRELWPATSGVNTFLWGPDLKRELQQRIEMRSRMSEEEKEKQRFPSFPKELQGGIIHEVWQKYIVIPMGDLRPVKEFRPTAPIRPARTVDDLEPEVRDHIREATVSSMKNAVIGQRVECVTDLRRRMGQFFERTLSSHMEWSDSVWPPRATARRSTHADAVPTGLVPDFRSYPGLTPWANEFRRVCGWSVCRSWRSQIHMQCFSTSQDWSTT